MTAEPTAKANVGAAATFRGLWRGARRSQAAWNEAKHPRADDGTFGSGPGRQRARRGPPTRFLAGLPGGLAFHGARPAPPPAGTVRTADPGEALEALAAGKRVELIDFRDVRTLLDRLVDVVADAEKRGEKAPEYDLCKVTVRGTSLFCVENKGIPRLKMPQLGGTPRPGTPADRLPKDDKGRVDLVIPFIAHLERRGIRVTETTTPAARLLASQRELNGAKVGSMAKAMRSDPNHPIWREPIFTSRDDYVVDGHHRWAAMVAVDADDERMGDLNMPNHKVDLPILDLLAEAVRYTDAMGIEPQGFHKARGALRAVRVGGKWEEHKHPRRTDGKFGTGMGNPAAPKTPKGPKPSAGPKVDARQGRPIEPRPRPRGGAPKMRPDPTVGAGQGAMTASEQAEQGRADAVDSLGKHGGPKAWTPERKALHDSIVAEHLKGQEASGSPTATFLGGGPAAGKSTVLGSAPPKGVVIDSDAIKAKLPEYQEMLAAKDANAAGFVHEESSYLAKRIQAEAVEGSMDFTLDGTGDSSIDKLRSKVEQARAKGHSTKGLYVTVDTDEAVRRANERGRKTGRVVPESVIRDTHAMVSRTLPKAIEEDLFDELTLWDTETTPPTLIGEKKTGGKWTVHDFPAWQRFTKKGDAVTKAADSAPTDAELTGEDAVRMLQAITGGRSFEDSGVPDTDLHRGRWDTYSAEVEKIKAAGQTVDIPYDWTMTPDDDDQGDGGGPGGQPAGPAPKGGNPDPTAKALVPAMIVNADGTETPLGPYSMHLLGDLTLSVSTPDGTAVLDVEKADQPAGADTFEVVDTDDGEGGVLFDLDGSLVLWAPTAKAFGAESLGCDLVFTDGDEVTFPAGFEGQPWPASDAGKMFLRPDVEKARTVRTPEGARHYGVPIGSPIPTGGKPGPPRMRPDPTRGAGQGRMTHSERQETPDDDSGGGSKMDRLIRDAVRNAHPRHPERWPKIEDELRDAMANGRGNTFMRDWAKRLVAGVARGSKPGDKGVGLADSVAAKYGKDSPQYRQALAHEERSRANRRKPVTKAAAGPPTEVRPEDRYTLGPLYPATPTGRALTAEDLDAHDEFVSDDDLQKSVWDYTRSGDRTIRLQHGNQPIGEWVELMCIPGPVTVDLALPTGETITKSFSEGTPFMGVIWNELGWELVKKGKIRGYSFGGSARKMTVDVA